MNNNTEHTIFPAQPFDVVSALDLIALNLISYHMSDERMPEDRFNAIMRYLRGLRDCAAAQGGIGEETVLDSVQFAARRIELCDLD